METTVELECRKVSKMWKESVDEAYQTDSRLLKIPGPTDPYRWFVLTARHPAHSLLTAFRSPVQAREFLQDMRFHPGNPFPGRNLLLRLDPIDYELEIEFWNSVYTLLALFGDHVHVFRVDFQHQFGREPLELKHDRVLQKCLAHLPNLRSLAVTIDYIVPPNYEDLNYIREHPLAQLPQLETLMVSCISPDFTASILASCCVPNKIRRLFLGDFRPSERLIYDEVLSFNNLEVLHAGLSIADLRRFEQPPPLTEMWLLGQGLNEFQPLFNLLERFGATLKKLALDGFIMKLKWTAEVGYDFRVNLPHLESLIMYQYEGPLDPFLGLSSLTCMLTILTVASEPQAWEGSAVQLVGTEEQMQNSNLWALIPSLQTFVIGGHGDRGIYVHVYKRNSENGLVVRQSSHD